MALPLKAMEEGSQPAYGKLCAENGREYYIYAQDDGEIKFGIGREKRDKDDRSYFFLSDMTTLSKLHCEIYWDIQEQGFFIKNLSKNKIMVECEEVAQNMHSKKLQNMTCIMISKIKVYFLLPQDS